MVLASTDKARLVLATAHHFGTKAGDLLLIGQIHAHSTRAGWGVAHIADGLREALEQNWLTKVGNSAFELTESGYAEMGPALATSFQKRPG